jgi:hypothetical protein
MTVNPEDRRVIDHGEVVVKSQPEERQSVEVKPMRYVLGVSLGLVVVALGAVYLIV